MEKEIDEKEIMIITGDEIEQKYQDFSFEDDEEWREKEYIIDFSRKVIYVSAGINDDAIFVSQIVNKNQTLNGIRIDSSHYIYSIFQIEEESKKKNSN